MIQILFSLFLSQALANKIQFQKSWVLPPDYKVENLKLGGLSGCFKKENQIYFVSDDRGGEGGARIVIFDWDSSNKELNLNSGRILKIKKSKSSKILDLEGIGINSSHEILLSNEGDLHKKPRQGPELFWVDNEGNRLREIELTSEFMPNLTGQQTQGIKNNSGFEGLALDLDLRIWGALLEHPVFTQENIYADHIAMIESNMNSLKIDRQYKYPLPKYEGSGVSLNMGVTEFLYKTQSDLLVLERGVELTMNGILTKGQICTAKKNKSDIIRDCHYIFNNDQVLLKEVPKIPNLEGLCWLNEKKTQFMVVSDNNFSKTENTVFLLYNLN